MKRTILAIVGVLLAAPSWAGGAHFAPHDIWVPPAAQRTSIERPRDIWVPPATRRTSIERPRDIWVPPASRSVSANRPSDIWVPPASHGTSIEAMGPLVKPAWKD